MGQISWCAVIRDAAPELNLTALQERLAAAWPGGVETLPCDSELAAALGCFCEYWDNGEKWMRLTSHRLQEAVKSELGTWADFWTFAGLADSYGYWMVKPPCLNQEAAIQETLKQVQQWRAIILDLDNEFCSIDDRTAGLSPAETLEVAAATLLRYSPCMGVAGRRFYYGFETWYMQFLVLMQWYAQAAGMDERCDCDVRALIETVVFNRDGFASYSVTPAAAQFLGQEMANSIGDSDYATVDSTQTWLQHRPNLASVPLPETPAHLSREVVCDTHLQFVESFDTGWIICRRAALPLFYAFAMGGSDPSSTVPADLSNCAKDLVLQHLTWLISNDETYINPARGHERATRMKAALALCRKDAKSGAALSFEMVAEWHRLAMGFSEPSRSTFRQHDAYAKLGRERYPKTETSEQQFRSLLSEAVSEAPISVRATRAYLDVCFFHPFDDGNSRVARLLMDFVLTRGGLFLGLCEPLFNLPNRADDFKGAAVLVQLVAQMALEAPPTLNSELEEWTMSARGQLANQPSESGARVLHPDCLLYTSPSPRDS
eukprot:TRINITY_DN5611_c0_g1_i2.p1 TRINITY_DN5611_c0_g1~~TRINITY_DN5611_c0_g1_i2.p1  ORF type:complete len:547 (-),score=86.54 TRINITY_DN5611_c0_g1_i2:136-1776(-)